MRLRPFDDRFDPISESILDVMLGHVTLPSCSRGNPYIYGAKVCRDYSILFIGREVDEIIQEIFIHIYDSGYHRILYTRASSIPNRYVISTIRDDHFSSSLYID